MMTVLAGDLRAGRPAFGRRRMSSRAKLAMLALIVISGSAIALILAATGVI